MKFLFPRAAVRQRQYLLVYGDTRVMVFNAIFNNISVISWRSFLMVGKTGGPGKNHRTAPSHLQTLSHNVVSSTYRLMDIRCYSTL